MSYFRYSARRAIIFFSIVVLLFCISSLLVGCGSKAKPPSEETNTQDYTFTVKVNNLTDIAKTREIQIKRKAAKHVPLDRDHNVRIVGFVGKEKAGKTWLVNQLFGTKLRTHWRSKDRDGLRILYHQQGADSWVIVNMLGEGRDPEKGHSTEERLWARETTDNNLVEALRFQIIEDLCHAIVFVVNDPWSSIPGEKEGPRLNPYSQVGYMIERQAQQKRTKEQPVVMVAHVLQNTTEIQVASTQIQKAKLNMKNSYYIPVWTMVSDEMYTTNAWTTRRAANVTIKVEDDVDSRTSTKFTAIFETSTQSLKLVSNFGFAKESSEAGNKINPSTSTKLLQSLKALLPNTHNVNMLKALQQSIHTSLPLVLNGKVKQEDKRPKQIVEANLTIALDGEKFNIMTSFEELLCKPNFALVLASPGRETFAASRWFSDAEVPPGQEFPVLSDSINDRGSRQIRTLELAMPRVKPEDVRLLQEDGQYIVEVTYRSSLPTNGGEIRAVEHTSCATQSECQYYRATFKSGTSRMILTQLEGWSVNVHDPSATLLEHGIYRIRATQE
jgi:hypothetical protein